MQIDTFGEILKQHGVRLGAGVPCSYFTPLVNYMTVDPGLDYVSSTSEGEAVAIAAGMVAAGKPAFALMQNSGLGNAVNPITSMLYIYKIPVVLLVSHRGQPGGQPDEPQHELMGQITEQMSEMCGLRTHVFDPERFGETLTSALRDQVPTAFIVRKGTLEGGPKAPPLSIRVQTGARAPANSGTFTPKLTREQALAAILPILNRGLSGDAKDAVAVVGTTGKLSRELYELDDREGDKKNRFYMVGSMGCAAGFGLGIARARPERQVLVLDGDGALLMKLGSLATAGAMGMSNFHHVTFDNGAHDSTGGQPTPSPAVDFATMALACGYKHAETVDDEASLRAALERHLAMPGPTHLRMIIGTGSRGELGRPKLTPQGCYQRFSAFLRGESEGARS
ncbi:MAG TPA: phosphonopyruvate decarboxylase [Polyangiales bacterium]|jgi:phosphonopyruvate decarboxylase|nr:phosphonopyruvate decarboxylase [Polyangiales bacterium]